MDADDVFVIACAVVGLLLIGMTIAQSFIARLPLSAAMLYLAVGVGLGPWGLGLLWLEPILQAKLLERLAEVAVLISLFVAGLKLAIPLRDRRWRIPIQLASVTMIITVAGVAAAGVYGMGMSLGAAVLLGAIIAPTDPVLASEVQLSDAEDRDRVRFGLTGEGGLNDGTAFPFVMLGLGLMSLHDLGDGGWRWWAVDVVWAVTGGLGIGYLLGALVGQVVIHLRSRHREALGSDEFIALGLIALAYGVALLCHAYGFLAVFAAGLALRRVGTASLPVPSPGDSQETDRTPAKAARPAAGAEVDAARSAVQEPSSMMTAVQQFNTQLERVAEVGLVIVVGALMARVEFRTEVLWFVPLLFLVIRPSAVLVGLAGTRVNQSQRRLMAWFGIRGIGSVYYLMYAISHGLDEATAEHLLSVTVAVVVASVVAHGISVTPLMHRYERRRARRSRQGSARS
jgi:NhaP-type Na+/H+ or K+/H+ antiporter